MPDTLISSPQSSLALLGDRTRAWVTAPRAMLIDGKPVDALSGKRMDVIDPATGAVVTSVPSGGPADIDAAVAAARRCFESASWRAMTPGERERTLFRLAELMERDAGLLAELEALDNGKPIAEASGFDVATAIAFVRYMAGWATKIEGSTLDVSLPRAGGTEWFACTRREPVGVVGAIIPWNFPLLMAAWKVAPALATGCTMVLKPASETPLSALYFAELVLEAGFPAGALNVVTGRGSDAGNHLAGHPGVEKIAFTGSTEIGRTVGHAALENMSRFSLELGGKSPMIVLDDADPAKVVPGAAIGIFFNQGQVCCAGSRLLVHKKLYDNVVADLAGLADGIRVGPGLSPDTRMGPLVSRRQKETVLGYVASGLEQGAERVTAEPDAPGEGFFVRPTILSNTNPDMRVFREEIFGPVLVAMPFDDVDEVARLANAGEYGLAASIWSNDLSRVHRLVPRIKAGTVWVNCHNAIDANMPFGGYKMSGLGRELGRNVLDLYTEVKSVVMAL